MRAQTKNAARPCTAMLLCLAITSAAATPAQGAIPLEIAKQYFAEAATSCKVDNGRLWGVSLCGPIMFVDPASRDVVASQADAAGKLQQDAGVFIGTLPPDQGVANTALEWAGERWTQIMWPLPAEAWRRRILIAHELFHRIQPQLHLPAGAEANNAHLDTVDGRVYMQLEWRALARALQSDSDTVRRKAAMDALLFRAARDQVFPSAAAQEQALEANEGLAEYTGVMVGAQSAAEQRRAALDDLSAHVGDETFVRSFAYATGPAYGMLLDRYAAGWRTHLASGQGFGAMLADALHAARPRDPRQQALARMNAYGGRELRASENRRDEAHQRLLSAYRAKFIEGPVLVLPLKHMQVQFDPRSLQPLGEAGTVYPTLHLSDDWGTLEVASGALISADWTRVTLPLPATTSATGIAGRGWTLVLKSGWKTSPTGRAGDMALRQESPASK